MGAAIWHFALLHFPVKYALNSCIGPFLKPLFVSFSSCWVIFFAQSFYSQTAKERLPAMRQKPKTDKESQNTFTIEEKIQELLAQNLELEERNAALLQAVAGCP
jgi:hypothetical protein